MSQHHWRMLAVSLPLLVLMAATVIGLIVVRWRAR